MIRRILFALSLAPLAVAQTPGSPAQDALVFQTGGSWSPRVNVESGTVMVYGINDDLPNRIKSWKDHGYRVALMTGVAWGRYGDYLRGDFDGKQHWNETQQEADGTLILHSGREVPYIAPSESYGTYLSQGVLRALDAGAEAVYLEEPEFWARAGWSDSFKHEWQSFYGEPWQAPDSTPDAQYRASKLKYFLYRRALAQVFVAVKQWSAAHGKTVPCYVATHSLINYAQWHIVSPESSLLDVGADGYIAQVWTGTSREPNVYEGVRAERTFETAFLEYGALQNIARSSGKRIWYLNDPIEDNANHSWADYKRNWESTLVASLLQPEVSSYEVLPWPDRIFGPKAFYPTSEPTGKGDATQRVPISPEYEAELQTVFYALGQMAGQSARWQVSGTEGVGVLVSDSLMFERAKPVTSDPDLSNFYGLALPLLMHGFPVEPVQIESTYRAANASAFLNHYKVLLLTYEGQKPPSPKFHDALAAWVRAGGALVVFDDDRDPYNHAKDWWNHNGENAATPRERLFASLGLKPAEEGAHRVGKGLVIFRAHSPSALAGSAAGAEEVLQSTREAAAQVHLPWHETHTLVLRRGPFVIGAGLDPRSGSPSAGDTVAGSSTTDAGRTSQDAQRHIAPGAGNAVQGRFIDLFAPHLAIVVDPVIAPGQHRFLVDLATIQGGGAHTLAASARVTEEHASEHSLNFAVSAIEARDAHDLTQVRVLLPRKAQAITLDGKALSPAGTEAGTTLLEFPARAETQRISISF